MDDSKIAEKIKGQIAGFGNRLCDGFVLISPPASLYCRRYIGIQACKGLEVIQT